MKTLRVTAIPRTSFGTPIAGDTFFGQLCWAIRERYGEERLGKLLAGYTDGRPFAVVSDGFPSGWLPRPTIPDFVLGITRDPRQRKQVRQRRWLPARDAGLPLEQWLAAAQDAKVGGQSIPDVSLVTQNTINRLTGTTGASQFAPRQVERYVFPSGAKIDLYVLVDTERLPADELLELLRDIGMTGYGRDASTGQGKFDVEAHETCAWHVDSARSWLTLAPCSPQLGLLEPTRCYYSPATRFGRHGSIASRGKLFKKPLLLAATGAFLTTRDPRPADFHGVGLGGTQAPISAIIPETVHQGYAPVVPLNMSR